MNIKMNITGVLLAFTGVGSIVFWITTIFRP